MYKNSTFAKFEQAEIILNKRYIKADGWSDVQKGSSWNVFVKTREYRYKIIDTYIQNFSHSFIEAEPPAH